MMHFTYITTNLINGKQYVGDHSTRNLDDGYLGSGKITLHPAFKKYGKKNFKREILEFFDTKQEAFDAQEKYIIKYNTLVPNGYNISPTGGSECGGYLSEETKRKISKAKKGVKFSDKHIKNLSNSHKGILHSEETKQKISESNIGKKYSYSIESKEKMKQPKSLEHKIKISNTLKGKKYSKERIENSKKGLKKAWDNPEKRKKQSEKLNSLNLNPSQETRNKISKALKGKTQPLIKCPYCNKEGKGNAMYRWHFENCKNKN